MSKRLFSRALCLLLAMTLCVCFFVPLSAYADTESFRLSGGDIVIGADGDRHYVTVGEKRTSLSADTEIIIDGANTESANTIRICDNIQVSVTLSGVRIKSADFLTSPLELSGAERVRLTIKGACSLSAPQYMAALQVSRYAQLTLLGGGTLSARGGMSAAGIGGGWKSGVAGAPSGSITIADSVTVSAYGGDYGAGIGGGEGGESGPISIAGSAKVYALGGKNAAGIGSGSGARAKNISVSGSATVEAAGGDGGAGIGSALGGAASKITLSGSSSVRACGGDGASAIGSGKDGSVNMILVRENASVRARAGSGAAGIGAGKNAPLVVGVTVSDFSSVFSLGGDGGAGIGGSQLSCGILTVSDSALVESYGGRGGAGIGGGTGGSLSQINFGGRVSVYAYGGLGAAGIGSGEGGSFDTIDCGGFACLQALGGKYGAGIGGGRGATCGTVLLHDSVDVTAQGGNFGAGIGTGAKNAPDHAPVAGKLYIYNNAVVRAAGGKSAAGIGGGLYAAGGLVTVADSAVVDAYADIIVSIDASTEVTKADYSLVEAALAKIPSNLAEYTEQSATLLQDTVSQVVYDLPVSEQARVDAYAAAIERAISVLVKRVATRTLKPKAEVFDSGLPILIDWTGATSPKDRIVVLKAGHLPSDTQIDPAFNVSYGTSLLTAYCVGESGLVEESGTASLSVSPTHFLHALGFSGLPEGAYTAYLMLEGSAVPAAKCDFTVSGTALTKADYSAVEEAISKMPQSAQGYTADSWKTLSDAIQAVVYDLPIEEQARVDGFAKAIRDAIGALVPLATQTLPASETRAVSSPYANIPAYTVSNLTHTPTHSEQAELILLAASSSGKPESPAWGRIPMQSTNTETAGEDSVVSAINYVPVTEDISVLTAESFDTRGILPSGIGAGAGCTMQGSLKAGDEVLINNAVPSVTITYEYAASIGTLTYDYAPGASFSLPTAPVCPGYIFQKWSNDEAGTSPASGTFTAAAPLTFYAHWEIVPVSIEESFRFSSAALGVPYSDRLQLTSNSADFSVTVTEGSLPKGLSLDPVSGTISGTPTDLGTYDFTLLILDANGTRTEKDYSITVFQSVQMTFTFYTSQNAHSATEGEISFYYSYRDRASGALKESAPINLTELASALSPTALSPESVDTVTLSVGAYVGQPEQLFFTNTSETDGWRIDRVVVSSEGGDGMDAFERTYSINAWIGHVDDESFFESGVFVIFILLLVLLLILLGVFFFLRYKRKCAPKGERKGQPPFPWFVPKQEREAKKGNAPAPTQATGTAPKTAGNAPQATGTAPKTASNAPQVTGTAPKTASSAPRATGAAPRVQAPTRTKRDSAQGTPKDGPKE